MKKVYSKPQIIVEDFALSSCIATGCMNSGQAFTEGCASNYDINAILDALDIMDGQLDGNYPNYSDGTLISIELNNQTVQVCYHSSQGVSVFTS